MTYTLKPSKELDALVAEKVMGWQLPEDPDLPKAWQQRVAEPSSKRLWAGYWAKEPTAEDNEGEWIYGEIFDPAPQWKWAGSEVWEPSRNMAHAWRVVEKLQEGRHAEWTCVVEVTVYYPGCAGCYISREVEPDKFESFGEVGGTSAPHAICLAALAALGVETA